MSNVPKLRFKEFSGEWKTKQLKEVTTYVDYRGRAPIKTDKGHFLVTAKNIKKGFIDYECSKEYVAKDDYANVMSKGLPEIGDVLFTTEAPMGNVAQVNDKNIALAQRVIKLRAKKIILNSYLLHYMLSPIYQSLILKKSIGTTVQGISGKELHKTNISFSSISEQEKIASFLTSVDTKIEQLTKKESLLQEYKKGVMQKIFNQEVRFKDEDGNEFCEWEMKYGNEVFRTITNKNHNSDLPILAISQEFGAIPRDMIDYQISVTDKSVATYKVVEIGDFIISLRSFQGGIEYSNYKGICSPAYIILRPHIEVDDRFYKLYMKTDNYIKELNKNIEGIRDGKMISFKQFSEIKLPYPSIEEQNKIANFLSSIDIKIEQTQKQLELSKEFKKALLQQMFV